MKKLIIPIITLLMTASCGNTKSDGTNTEDAVKADTSIVYFIEEITPESLVKVYEALGVKAEGNVCVKISTGEAGGHNYLKPELIGQLVNSVNGTIVECNTALISKNRLFLRIEH